MPRLGSLTGLTVLCALLFTPLEAAFAGEHVGDAKEEKAVYCRFRWGQGGFTDNRSDIGKLGGGQLTLDVKPRALPLALSISAEYYTNSANPTHLYEIASMTEVNLLYMTYPFGNKRVNVFAGGGVGSLGVPASELDPDHLERALLVDLEAGIDVRAYRKIGFYGVGKYLYSRKDKDGAAFIDFNEFIVLLGLTFSFHL